MFEETLLIGSRHAYAPFLYKLISLFTPKFLPRSRTRPNHSPISSGSLISIMTDYSNRCLPSDSDEDSDEEDDTAELLRELEKIKRERAEEKERLEREQNASQQAERDAEIATSNPLLNLAAALGQGPNNGIGVSTTAPGTFAVKRRWDDGKSFRFVNIPTVLGLVQIGWQRGEVR